MNKTKKYLLIDGNNVAFGLWSAVGKEGGGLTNSVGEPTTIIYGLLRVFNKFIDQYEVDHTCVFWDLGGGSKYRKTLFPSYKGNRSYKDMQAYFDELDQARRYLKMLGIDQISCKGIEADDLIGVFSRQFYHIGDTKRVILFSNDKDYYQLVNDRVHLYRPIVKHLYDLQEVKDANDGLYGKQLVRLQALVGQDKDNIPGACDLDDKGIMQKFGFGVKTAMKLDVKKYLPKIFNSLRSGNTPLNEKFTAQLLKNEEQVYLSYKLARIRMSKHLYDKWEVEAMVKAYDEIVNKKLIPIREVKQLSEFLEFEKIHLPLILRKFGVRIK